jgi:hypothetical protein
MKPLFLQGKDVSLHHEKRNRKTSTLIYKTNEKIARVKQAHCSKERDARESDSVW